MTHKIIIILSLITSLSAQEWAGYSGGFLRVGITARSIAMGGAFTAEKDYGFAAFYNPAWTAFLIKKQIGFSYSELSLDRRISGTSFSTSLPPTAGLGIAWVSAGVTDIQGRNSAGEKTEIMQTGEDAIMVTFAQRVLPWLAVGANIKILQHQLPVNEEYKGTGIGFDIGLLFKTGETTTFGLTIQDLSSNYQWNTGALYAEGRAYKDAFPTIYRAGTKFLIKSITIVADAGFITDHESFISFLPRIGTEYTYQDIYYFRGGLGNGRIAFGWGLEYDLLTDHDSRIDYTFSMDWASQTGHTLSYAFNF